ncbi:MAG: DUF5716 family protein [Agathobacter sp.]|nr:DUF5716 family protein [Agathobacter sp.]
MGYYLGIDLTDSYAMISYYQLNQKEPETVSLVAGGENYQIPLILAKKKNVSQWYFGEEAKRLSRMGEMICVESILSRATADEQILMEDEVYEARDLLLMYLKKLMALPQVLGSTPSYDCVVITIPSLNKENMMMFGEMAPKLGLSSKKLRVMDHKESFYYYAMSQPQDLWLHDVLLFQASREQLFYYTLKRNLHTKPQIITIDESPKDSFQMDRDETFLLALQKAMENRIVSTCYLTGDGFDGNWMHESLNFMCRGRRAFMGKNLYTKGAAYGAAVLDGQKPWEFVYLGENEMKFNLCLKVKNRGKEQFFDLITAGKNWFEEIGNVDVILTEGQEIVFWKQLPHSNEAKLETIELTDLPKRPERTSRIHIEAKPVSDTKVEITMQDLGFGELFRSSDKIWKYTMSI